MVSRREYSPETRAQVMAALLAGQTVREAAKQYRIPQGTVSSWERRLNGAP